MRSNVKWLGILLLLTGCATGGPAVTDGFCTVAKPILVSHRDALTDETARQVLVHNELGAKTCGW
jgi:hypothetical protein